MKNKKRGGSRAGPGRPKGNPTVTVSFRVPIPLVKIIKAMVESAMRDFKCGKEDHTVPPVVPKKGQSGAPIAQRPQPESDYLKQRRKAKQGLK